MYDCDMKKNIAALSILAFVVILISCGPVTKESSEKSELKASGQKEMLVYGANTCDHCINFKRKMDSLQIKYTFFDVEVDQTKADEMLRKLEQARFIGNISFPVVDIEGRVMVSPDIQQVLAFVKR